MLGLLVPSFGDVNYYFSINVLHFSKFSISMLTLLSYISLMGGTLLYNKYFKDFEIRSLLQMSQLCSVMGALINLVLILRLNITVLGINDLSFVVLTSIISDTMSLAFSFLPTLVLFTKITPNHIEASVFALLTGVFNFSNNVGS
jgi:hypothetical protein